MDFAPRASAGGRSACADQSRPRKRGLVDEERARDDVGTGLVVVRARNLHCASCTRCLHLAFGFVGARAPCSALITSRAERRDTPSSTAIDAEQHGRERLSRREFPERSGRLTEPSSSAGQAGSKIAVAFGDAQPGSRLSEFTRCQTPANVLCETRVRALSASSRSSPGSTRATPPARPARPAWRRASGSRPSRARARSSPRA